MVDGEEERGTHRVAWDGSDANGNFVPAGFYFYKLDAGDGEALGRLRVLTANSSSDRPASHRMAEGTFKTAQMRGA